MSELEWLGFSLVGKSPCLDLYRGWLSRVVCRPSGMLKGVGEEVDALELLGTMYCSVYG